MRRSISSPSRSSSGSGLRPDFGDAVARDDVDSGAGPTVVTASLSRGSGGSYAYYHCHR